MVLEEQPAKMAEALRHYLQGLGYGTSLISRMYQLFNCGFFNHFDRVFQCHTWVLPAFHWPTATVNKPSSKNSCFNEPHRVWPIRRPSMSPTWAWMPTREFRAWWKIKKSKSRHELLLVLFWFKTYIFAKEFLQHVSSRSNYQYKFTYPLETVHIYMHWIELNHFS